MVERLAFVGQISQDPMPFIKSSDLKYVGRLPDETPKNKLYFLADVHHATLEEDNKELIPLWAIDDRPEELLQAAQAMIKDLDETAREAIKNLSGNLTLIKLGADKPSFTLDQETGIRVFHVNGQQTPYPIHPTPDS